MLPRCYQIRRQYPRDPGDSLMAPDAAISTADGGCKASIYLATSEACHLLMR